MIREIVQNAIQAENYRGLTVIHEQENVIRSDKSLNRGRFLIKTGTTADAEFSRLTETLESDVNRPDYLQPETQFSNQIIITAGGGTQQFMAMPRYNESDGSNHFAHPRFSKTRKKHEPLSLGLNHDQYEDGYSFSIVQSEVLAILNRRRPGPRNLFSAYIEVCVVNSPALAQRPTIHKRIWIGANFKFI